MNARLQFSVLNKCGKHAEHIGRFNIEAVVLGHGYSRPPCVLITFNVGPILRKDQSSRHRASP